MSLKRIDRKYILTEIGSVFNFDKGILRTIKHMFSRPGASVQEYLHENRSRLTKPISFVIFCSLLYSLFSHYFPIEGFFNQFERGYAEALGIEKTTLFNLFQWTENNYGFANILLSMFVAPWVRLFFRKSGYNYFEVLVLLLYVMGIYTLIYAAFNLLEILSGYAFHYWGVLIGLIYFVWAVAQFYGKSKKRNYIKAALAYFLGFFLFYFSISVLGAFIDLANNPVTKA
ncbi:DUF3667 domain-containing protein [Aureicoccus marinus]|nr:DUF3667 domain-containing protein [Aureicoccus marinus]